MKRALGLAAASRCCLRPAPVPGTPGGSEPLPSSWRGAVDERRDSAAQTATGSCDAERTGLSADRRRHAGSGLAAGRLQRACRHRALAVLGRDVRADPDAPGQPVGLATAWSSYDDGTEGAFRVPGDASWYPGLERPETSIAAPTAAWGLRRRGSPRSRRTSKAELRRPAERWALHFRGGRFNYFGAGAEHPLAGRS